MGLREQNRGTVSTPGIVQEYLRNKEVLLFLDDFTTSTVHLRYNSRTCSPLAPKLRLIVTGGGLIRIRGEQEFTVPLHYPLPDLKRLPPSTELSDYDTVKVPLQRAQAVNPDFRISDENAPEVARDMWDWTLYP